MPPANFMICLDTPCDILAFKGADENGSGHFSDLRGFWVVITLEISLENIITKSVTPVHVTNCSEFTVLQYL